MPSALLVQSHPSSCNPRLDECTTCLRILCDPQVHLPLPSRAVHCSARCSLLPCRALLVPRSALLAEAVPKWKARGASSMPHLNPLSASFARLDATTPALQAPVELAPKREDVCNPSTVSSCPASPCHSRCKARCSGRIPRARIPSCRRLHPDTNPAITAPDALPPLCMIQCDTGPYSRNLGLGAKALCRV